MAPGCPHLYVSLETLISWFSQVFLIGIGARISRAVPPGAGLDTPGLTFAGQPSDTNAFSS